MRIVYLLAICVPLAAQYGVDLHLSRPVERLRAIVVAPSGREIVYSADLPPVFNPSLTGVPGGSWELRIVNALGDVITSQHISVPALNTIEVTLPAVASASPPVSLRRLAHRVPRPSEKSTRLGAMALQKGDSEEARRHFLKALDTDPENYEALNRLALLFVARRDYESAAAFFERAMAIDPTDPVLLVNSGNTQFQLHNFKLSLERAQSALRWAPDSPRAHVLAGLAAMSLHLGRDTALRHFEQAKGRLPGVEDLIRRFSGPR